MTDALRRSRNQRDSSLEFHECSLEAVSINGGRMQVSRFQGFKVEVSRYPIAQIALLCFSLLAVWRAAVASRRGSFQFSRPGLALNRVSPENTCAPRVLRLNIPR